MNELDKTSLVVKQAYSTLEESSSQITQAITKKRKEISEQFQIAKQDESMTLTPDPQSNTLNFWLLAACASISLGAILVAVFAILTPPLGITLGVVGGIGLASSIGLFVASRKNELKSSLSEEIISDHSNINPTH